MKATGRGSRRVKGLARAVAVGPRVFLRYPRPSDREEYLRLRRASRTFLRPWEATPPDGPPPFSEAAFERFLKTRRTSTSHRFLICSCQTGEILGQIALGGIVWGAFRSGFLGYWIGEPYAGHGYMSEALGLLLRFAFWELRLHRVEANIIPTNVPSRRVVRRHGFRHEGTARRYLRINGRWQDHERWALTVEEWRRR